jgi:hypothetical protein
MGRGETDVKKCIIMHVEGGFWRKVHYSALFGDGKRQEKALNTESAEAERKRKQAEARNNFCEGLS